LKPTGGLLVVLVLCASGCAGASSHAAVDTAAAAPVLADKPCVLLISIDTQRADGVGAYGSERATTPFIDSLAAEGIVFTRGYSTSAWTVPALASMLSSSLPEQHGMHQRALPDGLRWTVLGDALPSIAEEFQKNGYRTFGLTANFGLPADRGFGRGFDRYRCVGAAGVEGLRPVLDEWLPDIRAAERWFVWLHLFDPHAPYEAREPWIGQLWKGPRFADLENMAVNAYTERAPKLGEARMDYIRALYDSEIRHADAYVRRVYRSLPQAKDAIVLYTADHGEEFLEHSGTGHGHTLYEELVRVPFILRLPGGRFGGTRLEAPVSLIDVLPTLLGVAGLEVPPNAMGLNLIGPDGPTVPDGRVVVAQLESQRTLRAVTDGRWKWIQDGTDPQLGELYDLEADPGERRESRSAAPETVTRLAALLRETLQARPSALGSTTPISPEQLEALKALGYAK